MENRKKQKITLIIIAIIILLIISIILGKKFWVSADELVPEGSPITDLNLYKCVVDEYNGEFNEEYDYNHVFTDEELGKITHIGCKNLEGKIKDATGLDKLTELTSLSFNSNELTELDVSKNTKLTSLAVSTNKLTSIIGLNKLTELTNLYLERNELTELDVSKNIKLTSLAVGTNKLTSIIGLDKLTELTSLSFNSNELTELDLSKNTKLKILWVNDNKLTKIIGLDKLTELTHLNSFTNNLIELDLSKNTKLTNLSVSDNKLTSIIGLDKLTELMYISVGGNNLTKLDLSKNTKLTNINLSSALGSVDAFSEEVNINLNEPLELIKLPNNYSTYSFSVDSIEDETIIKKDSGSITGIKAGKTKVVSSLTGGSLGKQEIVQTYTVVDKNKPNDFSKDEDDKTDNNEKDNSCELSSSVYKIDNNDLIVDNVNREHSLATIKSNLTSNCGTIEVTDDAVVLDTEKDSKTYKINKIFMPKTGQTVIKYSLVIVILSILILVSLLIKFKISKK